MTSFWRDYPHIEKDLQAIMDLVQGASQSGDRYLDQSLDYLLLNKGKMLRPALVLIGSRFGPHADAHKDKLLHLAGSIETLHLATLVHDDIVDEAKLRRGQESIQSKYGKPYAVYMGDYLFTQCFLMLVDYSFAPENIKRVAEAIKRVCVGEMLQYQRRYVMDGSTKNYLKVISGKTASLLAISLGVGAYESGAPEEVAKTLGRIGYNVGMAFQIVDDLLDYKGDEKDFGKDTKTDILKGYYTLPIIRGLKSDAGGDIRAILEKVKLGQGDVETLIYLAKTSGAIASTEALAQKYTQRALNFVAQLPEGEGKEILQEVIPALLHRKK